MTYAVLWRRALVQSLDFAATTIFLAVLLFGIAMGNLLFARVTDRVKSRISLFGLMQIAVGISGVAAIPILGELLPIGGGIATLFGCTGVMIVPAVMIGGCFPLAVRIYPHDGARLGRSIGNVSAMHIVGAIAGVLCAGFIIVPFISVRQGIVLTSALSAIMGCAATFSAQANTVRTRQILNGTAAGGVILTVGFGLIVLYTGDNPLFIKNSGFLARGVGSTIISQIHGVDADISVLKDDKGTHQLYVGARKIADTSRWGYLSHRLIAHLPVLLHPEPKSALVVGFGMGLTAYSMTQHGVYVDTVESSKDVIEEARAHFANVNHHILSNPQFNLTIDDERNYLLVAGEKYDIISVRSFTSSPAAWYSQTNTTEFYRLCKRALNEDGILCQRLPLNLISEAHFKMALRTFLEVFPHTTLWYKYTPDFIVLIGTSERLKIEL